MCPSTCPVQDVSEQNPWSYCVLIGVGKRGGASGVHQEGKKKENSLQATTGIDLWTLRPQTGARLRGPPRQPLPVGISRPFIHVPPPHSLDHPGPTTMPGQQASCPVPFLPTAVARDPQEVALAGGIIVLGREAGEGDLPEPAMCSCLNESRLC